MVLHGQISGIEIPATDVERGKYSALAITFLQHQKLIPHLHSG
jgi:hypothetical protein